jgi:hypothetical protein
MKIHLPWRRCLFAHSAPPEALFAAGVVMALGEPRLKCRRGFLDALEPFLASRIRDHGLQSVVSIDLLDRIEDAWAIRRLSRRREPQPRSDDLKARSVTLDLEAERH